MSFLKLVPVFKQNNLKHIIQALNFKAKSKENSVRVTKKKDYYNFDKFQKNGSFIKRLKGITKRRNVP